MTPWKRIAGIVKTKIGFDPVEVVKVIETVKAHGTVSSGTESFDLDEGSYHTVTVGGNFAIVFVGWPTGLSSATIKLINAGAHTITWPASVDWPYGAEPAWTASGTDFVSLFSDDGGTIVYGKRTMTDVK
jgi:hypothetical protein